MTSPGLHARRIAIIGAGPGGICTGIKLLEAGFEDFTIFERAPGVGGTWFHNTYPGCACDIQSALYSFSFEIKRDWSRPYATQPEIRAYFEHCVEAYGLEPHLRLSTGIATARWSEEDSIWRLVTEHRDEHEFDVVVGAVGLFGKPVVPDIPGIDDFDGTMFHSARWDHTHDLAGERVAVIGSAASAVQLVPAIAPDVAQLHVFQRTPNWVLPREDTPYTEEELAHFRDDLDAIPALRREIFERIDPLITFSNPALVAGSEVIERENLQQVDDPDVRARLTPNFPHGCKRPLISSDWYPTFNRPNVELVTDAIERITPGPVAGEGGVVTVDGVCRAVDTIVLATGFSTTRYLAAIEVTGRDGVRLDEAWRDGAQAYLGITTSGFPNLFLLYGPNTNNGSILYMIECQVEYVLRQLTRMVDERLAWIDVRPEVEAAYNEALQADLDGVAVWQADCSGYYRAPSGRIVTQWPHSMSEYRARTSRPDPEAFAVGTR